MINETEKPTTKTSLLWSAIFLIIFLTASSLAIFQKIGNPQTLFNLKIGGEISSKIRIPDKDIFSASNAGHQWKNYDWLNQIFLFEAKSLPTILNLTGLPKNGEWFFINLLSGTFFLAAVILSTLFMFPKTYAWNLRFLFLSIFAISLIPFGVGSQAFFTALLTAIILSIAMVTPGKILPLTLLPIIVLLWSNTTPSVLTAILISWITLYRSIQEPHLSLFKKSFIALIGILIIIAAFGNPFGLNLSYPSIEVGESLLVSVFLTLFLSYHIWKNKGSQNIVKFLPTIILLTTSLFYPIFIPAVIISLFPIITHKDQSLNTNASSFNLIQLSLAVGCVFCTLILLIINGKVPSDFGYGLKSKYFPETAAGRLSAFPIRGTVLSDLDSADYYTYTLWPGWKVAYNKLAIPNHKKEYLDLVNGKENWKTLFASYNIYAVAFPTEEYPIIEALRFEPEWQLVWWDAQSVVLLRNDIDIEGTSITPYRAFKPGGTFEEQLDFHRKAGSIEALKADIRRAVQDDPTNIRAINFYHFLNDKT